MYEQKTPMNIWMQESFALVGKVFIMPPSSYQKRRTYIFFKYKYFDSIVVDWQGKIDNWVKWHGFCSVNSFDQTFCQVKDKVSIWWFLLRQSKESICWLENLKAPSFSWKLPCTMNGQHVNHTQNLIVCLNFNVRSFIICHCLVTGDTGGLLLCSQTRVSGHTIGSGGFGSFTHS